MALTIVDAEDYTLTSANGTTGVTGFASNGPPSTSLKPWMAFYIGQFSRDVTTMETGSAAIKVRATNNASGVANCKMITRFKPRDAAGANRVLDGLHGLWRIRVDEVPDYSDGTAGSTGVGYHTNPGTVLEVREPTTANVICGVYMVDQGESTALYVTHTGDTVAQATDPDRWLGDLPYGEWVWLEGSVDLDHNSSTQARQAWRIVFPDGNPGRWVHDIWSRAHSSGTDACYWTFGFTSKDTTAVVVRNWEYLSLDRYIIAESADWWAKYDSDGFGNDGLSPDLQIAYVTCDNNPIAIAGAAWGIAGTGAYNEVPSDSPTTANLRSSATNLNSFRVGFATAGSYNAYTPTDVGTVCAVVVKATMGLNTNDTSTDGEIGIRSAGGTVTSHTMDVFSSNWADCNSYAYASNVQPGGSTRWDASSTPMVDLVGMSIYIARGSAAGFLRVHDIGAYVVYRPTQATPSAVAAPGELASVPSVTAPAADCGYVEVDWRSAVEGAPYNVGGTDYTSVPIFASRSTKDHCAYSANWGVYPYETNLPPDGTPSNSVPMIVRYDLAAGTSDIVWRATATVAKSGSYTSTPPPGGPPATNGSGQWGWERWNGGTMLPYNMRVHRVCVDKWPTYTDGVTPNPFYGWIYAVFARSDYNHSTDDAADYNRPCHGIMFLDPSRAYAGGDGVLCMAKMIAFPTNTSSVSPSVGGFGVSCNPDEILVTRSQIATGQDSMHLLSKQAVAADLDVNGMPDTTDTTGWWSTHTFQTWVSDPSEVMNQTAYGTNKLWASGGSFYQLIKTATNHFDSKRKTRFGRGNNTFRYSQVRIWDPSPGGVMYGVCELDSGSVTVGDSRVTYGGTLQKGRSSLCLLRMTPGSSSVDPAVTKHWRVPIDQFFDAPANGEWRDSKVAIACLSVTDEDIIVSVSEAYNSVGDVFFPRHCLAWFNTRRNEWREVQRPTLNANLYDVQWYLLPDATMSGGTNPQNRHDMYNGLQPLSGDLWRFIAVDGGWPDGDYPYPQGGNVSTANLGAVYGGDVGPGPWRRQSDIAVDFTVNVPVGGGLTALDAWRLEVDGDGKLGSGLLVDGSDTPITAIGGQVTIHASIPADQVPDHASDTITIDVYFKVGGVWSARQP